MVQGQTSTETIRIAALITCMLWGLAVAMVPASAQQELQKTASWQVPRSEDVRQVVFQWLIDSGRELDEFPGLRDLLDDDDRLSQSPLDSATTALGMIIPETNRIIDVVQRPIRGTQSSAKLLSAGELAENQWPASARRHLQLIIGKWYAQNQRYDESLNQLQSLHVVEVVDPASLLFYRGLCQHRLLNKEDCLQTMDRLLENQAQVPRRFRVLAELMLADIKPVEADSLDEIARMMDDINRRQALHRSGTRVINQEKEVLEKLDKLIKKIEQQLQQQQQAAGGMSNPSNPMQDSQNAAGGGTGKVRDREIGEGGSWGQLPPKKRAAALAEMAKDLPPHYREVIEEYFRQLARQSDK